jgi:hypothetical protein
MANLQGLLRLEAFFTPIPSKKLNINRDYRVSPITILDFSTNPPSSPASE